MNTEKKLKQTKRPVPVAVQRIVRTRIALAIEGSLPQVEQVSVILGPSFSSFASSILEHPKIAGRLARRLSGCKAAAQKELESVLLILRSRIQVSYLDALRDVVNS